MPKIKILTSKYEGKMEDLINALLSEGYEMHGEIINKETIFKEDLQM